MQAVSIHQQPSFDASDTSFDVCDLSNSVEIDDEVEPYSYSAARSDLSGLSTSISVVSIFVFAKKK